MGWLKYFAFLASPLILLGAESGSRSEYWLNKGKRELEETLKISENLNKAKNMILFISDGMGISQTTATRYLKGQLTKTPGEEGLLFYETFPYLGLSKVYSNDNIIPDSSSTATAILSGVKVNHYTVGLSPDVKKDDCSASLDPHNHLKNIFKYAQDAGKYTGIITNTRITHATPSAAYSFSAHRNWESDKDKPASAKDCDDIALQFIRNNVSRNFKVAFGGGWERFLPQSLKGVRKDERNLIEEWKQDKSLRRISHNYVNSVEQLRDIDLDQKEDILGLFGSSHLPFAVEKKDVPSLEEMVKVAITKLKQSDKGFVLMVESGRGDKALHLNQAKKALYEVLELEKAVKMAKDLTSDKDTLIIVTSDHSQSLVINGKAPRGSDILGFGDANSEVDGLPYTVLSFGNGPGYKTHVIDNNMTRLNLTETDTTADNFIQPSAFTPRNKDAFHSGEDVAIYASGPMGHLLRGVHEENYIFNAMCYASCICGSKYSCHSDSST